MTTKTKAPPVVFPGASLALILLTLPAVFLGSVDTTYVPTEWLQRIVAVAFILIGALRLCDIL